MEAPILTNCPWRSNCGLRGHFSRRKEPLFDTDSSRNLWADPVECLLETMIIIGSQADGYHYLRGKDMKRSGGASLVSPLDDNDRRMS